MEGGKVAVVWRESVCARRPRRSFVHNAARASYHQVHE